MIPRCIVALAIQAAALFFALTPVTAGASLPLRILVGAISGLLLPGALINSALGLRSRHFLETLAVSAFGSFALIAVLALGAMSLQAPPSVVIAALFFVTVSLTFVCLRRRPESARFLSPRWRGVADSILGILLAGLCVVAYRWGDDVGAVDWELSLHLGYVRQYASALPLGFELAVLRPPEAIAQNYLYLWEFLLAVAAGLSGVDPLVAALKFRWIVPLLSFASFFFMAQRLTASTRTALGATWVMLAAVLTQFLTLAPNPYEAHVDSGPLRQVGAFLASIHHSDTAMEILLPAVTGYLFWALRRGTAKAWGAFAGALIIAFLWHPREYFQVMWYGAVAVLVDLVAGLPALKRRLVNYAALAACCVGTAIALYVAMPASIRSSSEHAAGLATQGQAVLQFLAGARDLSSWGTFSLPFSFHLHGFELAGLSPGAPMSFSWLVLAAPAALVLPFLGGKRLRWLGLYLLVLWLTSLCSLKGGQLLQAVTYGEMLISKPRLVHLFAYLVVGIGWTFLIGMIGTTRDGRFSPTRAFLGALSLGAVFAFVWTFSVPEFAVLFAVLNVAFFAAAGLLIWTLRWPRALTPPRLAQPSPLIAALTFVAFAIPVSGASLERRWSTMLESSLDPQSVFSTANPLGLAPDTLQYFQRVHPPRQRLLVEPNQPHMLGIYAPVYVMPLLGNVGADAAQLQLGREGLHPVFNKAMLNGAPDLGSVRAFLDERRVAHLLGAAAFAPAFLDLASRHPSEFAVNFVSRDRSNVVLEYLRRPR